jgi:hypothetical protein
MARAKPFHLTMPAVREHGLHRQLADLLRIEVAPPGRVSDAGVTWWSVDASNYNDRIPGLRTTRGQIPGVPDLILVHDGRAFFIEIKRQPDGVLSAAQQDVAIAILLCGARFAVVTSADELLAALDQWRIPRARRVKLAAQIAEPA